MNFARAWGGWVLVATVLAGCPRSSEPGDAGEAGVTAEAGVDAGGMDAAVRPDVVDLDAPRTDTPASGSDARDAYINIFEIIPLPEGGAAGECASCVESRCGTDVNNCVNNDACRSGLTCTVTRCLGGRGGDAGGGGGGGGGGGLDLACINTCFMGDLASAAQAIGAFRCILGTCGMTCATAFGMGGGDAGGAVDATVTPDATSSEAGGAADASAGD